MRLFRLTALAAVPVILAALVSLAAPASADVHINALVDNALAATGSAVANLDGVAVEAVVLPSAAQ